MPVKFPRVEFVSLLEPRRLLSFTPIGREVAVAIGGGYRSYDVAVSADGVARVARVSVVRSPSLGRDVTVLSVQAFDALGRPDTPRVVSRYAQPDAGVAIDANANRQAVIAYVERRGGMEVLMVRRVDTFGLGEAEDPGRPVFSKPVTRRGDGRSSAFGQVAVSMADNGAFFVAHRGVDSADLVVQYVGPDVNARPNVISALDNATASTGAYTGLSTFDIAARPDGSGAVFTAGLYDGVDGVMYGAVGTTAKSGVDRRVFAADAVDPAVAVLAGGGFVVTYSDNTLSDIFGGAGTAAQPFNASGVTRGPAIRLESGLPTDTGPIESGNTSVAATADGGFVVAFDSVGMNDAGLTPEPGYARRYAADGTPDESGPVALTLGNSSGTAIDVDAYGNALVAYAKPGPGVTTAPARAIGLRRVTSGILTDRGEVYLVGTNGNDAIRVEPASRSDGRVRVTVNGQSRRLPAAHVGAVSVVGLDGNDRVDINRAVPATVSGGNGNDTIFGSEAADVLRGDDGDDRLYGHGGRDTLTGGRGADFLRGGVGDDVLNGDANDTGLS